MASRKKKKGVGVPLSTVAAKWVLSNLPFVFFLGFLTTIYIANRHYSEKNIREIQALQEDVDRLRWYYLSLKSELMKASKQTEVQKMVETTQLTNKGERPIILKKEK